MSQDEPRFRTRTEADPDPEELKRLMERQDVLDFCVRYLRSPALPWQLRVVAQVLDTPPDRTGHVRAAPARARASSGREHTATRRRALPTRRTGVRRLMAKRKYVLEIDTSAEKPEHLARVDQEVARALHLAFGERLTLHVYETAASQTRPVLFDPVVHDGEEPPGYVPAYAQTALDQAVGLGWVKNRNTGETVTPDQT